MGDRGKSISFYRLLFSLSPSLFPPPLRYFSLSFSRKGCACVLGAAAEEAENMQRRREEEGRGRILVEERGMAFDKRNSAIKYQYSFESLKLKTSLKELVQ